MGHLLKRLSSGLDEKKNKEIDTIIEKCYSDFYTKFDSPNYNVADFYQAVSETVVEINKAFDNTQFLVPSANKVKNSYHRAHHENSEEPVSKEEFQRILHELLISNVRFTGVGAKNTLMYIFGVPISAFLVKQGLFPCAIRNDIFIPGVTSITVLLLAMLNKI